MSADSLQGRLVLCDSTSACPDLTAVALFPCLALTQGMLLVAADHCVQLQAVVIDVASFGHVLA